MASIYREKKSTDQKYRNYDQEILSAEDYERLQGYQQDWHNATDEAGRAQAHQSAQQLREQYGYSMGAGGNQFSILKPMQGVSTDTNAQLLHYQNQANNPTGNSGLYDQWQALLQQYTDRAPFSYDLAGDALYQQYAQQYQRLGNQAMQDTLGQAAGLTGGYDSSYAQNAGQQAYQGYLDQLNDVVPELYQQAYGRYAAEGDRIANAAQLAAQGYGQQVQDYWNNLNYWQNQATNEQSFATNQTQQAYSNLVTAISNTGYKPTAQELAAAGMTQEEANQWAAYFNFQRAQATKSSSGSGGGGGRRSGGRGRSSGGSGSGGAGRVWSAVQQMVDAQGTGRDAPWLDSGWLESQLRSQDYSTSEIRQIQTYLHDVHGWRYMYEGK